jgi:hypothetical protein
MDAVSIGVGWKDILPIREPDVCQAFDLFWAEMYLPDIRTTTDVFIFAVFTVTLR